MQSERSQRTMVIFSFGSLVFVALAGVQVPNCRCRAPALCFADIPFTELNASVNGRLVEVLDEVHACLDEAPTAACQTALARTDEQFFYTDQVGGFLHTGLAAGGGRPPLEDHSQPFGVCSGGADRRGCDRYGRVCGQTQSTSGGQRHGP